MENLIFEFLFDDNSEHFTTAIVKDAAVEKKLSYFNQEKPLFFANEEKRTIYAVAMEPNKLIYRKATNELPEHYGFFSAQSIEKFQENYAKHQGDKLVNIGHVETPIEGVYKIENWIVKDSEMDKTKALGIDAVSGSLIQGFKIENDAVWEQCKNGNLDGLSIEAHLSRKLVSNFKTNIEMNKEKNPQKLWDLMKSFFSSDVEETEEEKAARIAKEEADKMDEQTTTEPTEAEPSEDMVKLQEENEMLKAKVSELETKLADIEAEKVTANTELTTMKSEKEKAVADLEKFKSENTNAVEIKNTPKEVFSSEASTPYEKFRNHYKKFK
jgi:hypothetical protein